MASDRELADRIRDGLAALQPVREVKMFGGLGFMINDKLTVFARRDGGLILRCSPSRVGELELKGAQIAEMGGRAAGAGWIQVSADQVLTTETLGFWLGVAVDHRCSPTRSTTNKSTVNGRSSSRR
jgi:TfoX N-terminal domain